MRQDDAVAGSIVIEILLILIIIRFSFNKTTNNILVASRAAAVLGFSKFSVYLNNIFKKYVLFEQSNLALYLRPVRKQILVLRLYFQHFQHNFFC